MVGSPLPSDGDFTRNKDGLSTHKVLEAEGMEKNEPRPASAKGRDQCPNQE
jgi:hypothetical protein